MSTFTQIGIHTTSSHWNKSVISKKHVETLDANWNPVKLTPIITTKLDEWETFWFIPYSVQSSPVFYGELL